MSFLTLESVTIENFINKNDLKDFVCSGCNILILRVYESNVCEHLVCDSCANKFENCPVCKKSSKYNKSFYLDKWLRKQKILCNINQCNEVITLNEIDSHNNKHFITFNDLNKNIQGLPNTFKAKYGITAVTGNIILEPAKQQVTGNIIPELAKQQVTGNIIPELPKQQVPRNNPPEVSKLAVTGNIQYESSKIPVTRNIPELTIQPIARKYASEPPKQQLNDNNMSWSCNIHGLLLFEQTNVPRVSPIVTNPRQADNTNNKVPGSKLSPIDLSNTSTNINPVIADDLGSNIKYTWCRQVKTYGYRTKNGPYFYNNKKTFRFKWSCCDSQAENPTHHELKVPSLDFPLPDESLKDKNVSKGEKICQKILKEIYPKYKFSKIRPQWLKNPDTGYPLELDFYNQELRIGIEYNGIQHYEYVPFFHRTKDGFERQKKRDTDKQYMCKNNKILLISVPYIYKNEKQIKEYIIGQIGINRRPM